MIVFISEYIWSGQCVWDGQSVLRCCTVCKAIRIPVLSVCQEFRNGEWLEWLGHPSSSGPQGTQSVGGYQSTYVLWWHISPMPPHRPGWNLASPGAVGPKDSQNPDGGKWLLLAINIQTSSLFLPLSSLATYVAFKVSSLTPWLPGGERRRSSSIAAVS